MRPHALPIPLMEDDMSKARVPFLNLKAFFAKNREAILAELSGLMERGEFIGGPTVQRFEQAFAAWIGGEVTALGCANGTDAITVAAQALELPAGSEAIVPAMTFFATAEGLRNAGLRVRLIDVEPGTWLLDPKLLAGAIDRHTKLIVPVHLYGQMADTAEIRRIADQKGCRVLEDAAQAHGARRGGHGVGHFGDIATFSFYPGKNLGAFGDAGAVVSRHAKLIDTCREIANHGSVEKYRHDLWGCNSRMDAIQAAVLNLKLAFIDEWNRHRRKVAGLYRQALSGIPGIELPVEAPQAEHVYHLYVIVTEQRDKLKAHLHERGIETGFHYPSAIHQLAACRDEAFARGTFPNATRIAACGISLPMCPTLTEAQIDEVATAIRAFHRTGPSRHPIAA